jgi:hypothetical protein
MYCAVHGRTPHTQLYALYFYLLYSAAFDGGVKEPVGGENGHER